MYKYNIIPSMCEWEEIFDKKIFADFKLIIKNESGYKIEMDLHRIKLFQSCQYFFTKFRSNLKIDNDGSEIIVAFPNAAYDIIAGFYQKKTNIGNVSDVRHMLELCICADFLRVEGYDIDSSVTIQKEKDLIEIIYCYEKWLHNNTKFIELIRNNLTLEYDLENIPDYILKEIHGLGTRYYTADVKNNILEISLYNENKHGEIIHEESMPTTDSELSINSKSIMFLMSSSKDGKFLVLVCIYGEGGRGQNICVFDTCTCEIIKNIKYPHQLTLNYTEDEDILYLEDKIKFTLDNSKLIIAHNHFEGNIFILDILSEEIINIGNVDNIASFDISSDDIIYACNFDCVYSIDIKTKQKEELFNFCPPGQKIIYCPKIYYSHQINNFILIITDKGLTYINSTPYLLFNNEKMGYITRTSFSDDEKNIFFRYQDSEYGDCFCAFDLVEKIFSYLDFNNAGSWSLFFRRHFDHDSLLCFPVFNDSLLSEKIKEYLENHVKSQ
jgi:hypothetical protein